MVVRSCRCRQELGGGHQRARDCAAGPCDLGRRALRCYTRAPPSPLPLSTHVQHPPDPRHDAGALVAQAWGVQRDHEQRAADVHEPAILHGRAGGGHTNDHRDRPHPVLHLPQGHRPTDAFRPAGCPGRAAGVQGRLGLGCVRVERRMRAVCVE
eukprot:3687053-Prymnesium_polylepis.2